MDQQAKARRDVLHREFKCALLENSNVKKADNPDELAYKYATHMTSFEFYVSRFGEHPSRKFFLHITKERVEDFLKTARREDVLNCTKIEKNLNDLSIAWDENLDYDCIPGTFEELVPFIDYFVSDLIPPDQPSDSFIQRIMAYFSY